MTIRRRSFWTLTALTLAACSSDPAAPTGGTSGAKDAGGDSAIVKDAGNNGNGDSSAPAQDAGNDGATPPQDDASADAAAPRFVCPPGPFGNPLASGSKPVLVAGVPPSDSFVSGPGVLEGPVWIDGALYMTQFENHAVPVSRILKWIPSGTVSIVNTDSGANGMAVDIHGSLVAGIHKDGSISRFDSSGTSIASVLAATYNGARFDSPNDLALRDDGNIYFSDPDYQAPATRPQSKTRVYRIAPGGVVSVIDDALSEPNGVTLSPDQTHLYVSGGSGVFVYDVANDGSVSGKTSYGDGGNLQGSDGMGIDCAGNLYVAYQKNVVVLDTTGKELSRIAVDGSGSVTNLAFGGTDRKTLFITNLGDTAQGLHSMAIDVPGLPY